MAVFSLLNFLIRSNPYLVFEIQIVKEKTQNKYSNNDGNSPTWKAAVNQ